MGDFPLVELHSTSIQIIDGDRGVNYPKKTEFSEQGYCLFLDSSNLTKNGFDFSSKTFISKAVDERMGKGRLQRGDLVMNTRGTIGNIGLYSDNIPFESVRINSGMVIIRGGEDYDTRFLYLFLRSNMFFAQTKNLMSGSVQKQLPVSVIKYVKLPKVDLSIQQKIAAVLSALDAKIELNQRINAELESMAKTLYDYWFVQFAPLSFGHPPKYDMETLGNTESQPVVFGGTEGGYKSAGGKMVWNEALKREIPLGWEVKKIGEFGEFKNGINYDPSIQGNVDAKIINIRNISSSNLFVSQHELDTITLEKNNVDKYLVTEKDILIARSGIPGATRIMFEYAENTIYCGFIIRFQVNNVDNKNYLLYFLKGMEKNSKSSSGGTIMPNINQETLKRMLVLMPDKQTISKFNSFISPIFAEINSRAKESQTLTELRDWLLPMLMNGQVTVG